VFHNPLIYYIYIYIYIYILQRQSGRERSGAGICFPSSVATADLAYYLAGGGILYVYIYADAAPSDKENGGTPHRIPRKNYKQSKKSET
jgi:hypothetical protein